VLGLLAVLAIAKTLVTSPLFALVGIAGLLVCMTVIYFFARAVEQSADVVAMPVVVFTWFMLLVFMGIIGCLFTSIFFNAPLELKDKLFSREVAAAAADAGLKDLASKVKGLSPDALIEIARINVSLNGAVGTGPGADDLFLVKPSAGLLDLDRHNLIEWSMGRAEFESLLTRLGIQKVQDGGELRLRPTRALTPEEMKSVRSYTYRLNAEGQSLYKLMIQTLVKQLQDAA